MQRNCMPNARKNVRHALLFADDVLGRTLCGHKISFFYSKVYPEEKKLCHTHPCAVLLHTTNQYDVI